MTAPVPHTREALLAAARDAYTDGPAAVWEQGDVEYAVDAVLNLLDAHLALKLDDRNSGWNDAIRVVRADIATWRTP